jgi:hypothetical protein
MIEFSRFSRSKKATRFEMREFEKICADFVWICNYRDMSSRIFLINAIFLCAEWKSTKVTAWLCWLFIIFNNQELSSLSFMRFFIKEKKHSMHRLMIWRHSFSFTFFNLSFLSHIIQVFFFELEIFNTKKHHNIIFRSDMLVNFFNKILQWFKDLFIWWKE